jgi:hypothetical protein
MALDAALAAARAARNLLELCRLRAVVEDRLAAYIVAGHPVRGPADPKERDMDALDIGDGVLEPDDMPKRRTEMVRAGKGEAIAGRKDS